MRHLLLSASLFALAAPLNAAVYPERDLNKLISNHEQPIIGSNDRCANDATCHSLPQHCDQIIQTNQSWSSIDWSNDVICLTPGDHTNKGTLNPRWHKKGSGKHWIIPSTWAGTRSAESLKHPSQENDRNQTIVKRIALYDDFNVNIAGLTLRPADTTAALISLVKGQKERDGSAACANMFLSHVYIDASEMGTSKQKGGNAAITIDTSCSMIQWVYMVGPQPRYNYDGDGIRYGARTKSHRLIRSELVDFNHAILTGGNNNNVNARLSDVIVADNDIYRSGKYFLKADTSLTCNGGKRCRSGQRIDMRVFNSNGEAGAGESLIATKDGSNDPKKPMIFERNRIWGMRSMRENVGGTNAGFTGKDKKELVTACAVTFNQRTRNTIIRDNIIFDSTCGIGTPNATATKDGMQTIIVTRNIIDNSENLNDEGYPPAALSISNAREWAIYRNLIIGPGGERWRWVHDHGRRIRGNSNIADIQCNTIVDGRASDISGMNRINANNNAYLDNNNAHLNERNRYEGGSNFLKPYKFQRKLISGAQMVTLGNVIPTRPPNDWTNICRNADQERWAKLTSNDQINFGVPHPFGDSSEPLKAINDWYRSRKLPSRDL
jgi:hypothetical protein